MCSSSSAVAQRERAADNREADFFSPPRIRSLRFHVGEGEMLGARKDNKENIGLGWKSASSSDSAAAAFIFVCARVSLLFDVSALFNGLKHSTSRMHDTFLVVRSKTLQFA